MRHNYPTMPARASPRLTDPRSLVMFAVGAAAGTVGATATALAYVGGF